MPLSGPPLDQPIDLRNVLGRGLESKPDGVALVSAEGQLDLARAGPGERPLCGQSARFRRRKGDRVASLMPNRQCARDPLPRLHEGGPRRDAAQLPLHAAGDRSCARGQRGRDPARPRRARRDLAASKLAAGCRWGRFATAPRTTGSPSFEELLERRLARTSAADPGAVRSGGHLLHLGQHRKAQGRHPHARDFWLVARRRGSRATSDGGRRVLPGSSISHVGGIRARVRPPWRPGARVRRRADLRRRRAAAAAAPAPADGALHAARGADHPGARPRVRRGRTSPRSDFASPAATRSPPNWSANSPTLTGFPIDESYGMTEIGISNAQPALGGQQARLDRAGQRGSPSRFATTSGSELPAGDEGRLWVKSPGNMVGYWNNAATRPRRPSRTAGSTPATS